MGDDSQLVIFSNLPLLQELCLVVVSIDPNEVKDSSVKSDYQWQLLKTRILLFSDVNVVASPMLGELCYINVVCKQVYYTTGSLASLLEKNRLKVELVSKVSLETYEACLMYHLITKLAPDWNRVEKMFVEGRYFLLERGPLGAVEIHCVLSGDKLLLYIQPLRLWLRTVDLEDFQLSAKSILQQSAAERFYKDLSHEPQWVHVLPSFKRGRIVYVANYIPEKCTFENYQQMRRHWKNTYGFRLPDDSLSMMYVGINFFGPLDYTYPLVCVRRGLHTNVGDPKLILNFTDALSKKASIVCGNRLKLVKLPPGVIQSQFMVEAELNWGEENILNRNRFGSEENAVMNNTQISLSSQTRTDYESIQSGSGNSRDNSCDEWLTKCSNFIEGLSRAEPKRSRLLALSKPLFMKRPRKFMNPSQVRPLFLGEEKSSDQNDDHNDNEKVDSTLQITKEECPKMIPHFQQNKLHFPKPSLFICSSKNNRGRGSIGGASAEPNTPYKPVFVGKVNKTTTGYSMKPTESGGNPSASGIVKSHEPTTSFPSNKMLKPVFFKPNQPQITTPVRTKKSVSRTSAEKKMDQNSNKVKKTPSTYTKNAIESLYKAGKLNKVNTASLLVFLKENGIECKRNEKKQVLLSKAELFFSHSLPKVES